MNEEYRVLLFVVLLVGYAFVGGTTVGIARMLWPKERGLSLRLMGILWPFAVAPLITIGALYLFVRWAAWVAGEKWAAEQPERGHQ